MALALDDLLARVVDLGASDLHVTAGVEPCVRINGELKRLTEFSALSNRDVERLIMGILSPKQRETFERDLELDISYAIPGVGRYRVNVFSQRHSIGAVLRTIPFDVLPLEELGLPESLDAFAELPRGLVLVTGPTGSGKSTTLAALIDRINRTRAVHIMTIEDPIEYLHRHDMAIVNQRELGEDTHSYSVALKQALRQDPDVILVGELRDLEAIQCALTAAATGHLVFASLHTQDATQTIEHIVDSFPEHQQVQARSKLSNTLSGIVTQQLLPAANGPHRMCASEVLVVTPAVRGLLREGKTHQLSSVIQAGARYGMQTMDQSLAALLQRGAIDQATAEEHCIDSEALRHLAAKR